GAPPGAIPASASSTNASWRGGGQSQEGRAGGVQAQAAHHPQRDGQAPDFLAGSGGLSLPGSGQGTAQLLIWDVRQKTHSAGQMSTSSGTTPWNTAGTRP